MVPEIGHFALILALMLAVVQSTAPLIGAHRRDPVLMALAPHLAIGQLFLIAVAFLWPGPSGFSISALHCQARCFVPVR